MDTLFPHLLTISGLPLFVRELEAELKRDYAVSAVSLSVEINTGIDDKVRYTLGVTDELKQFHCRYGANFQASLSSVKEELVLRADLNQAKRDMAAKLIAEVEGFVA